ncbi:MAG: S-layer homology domain-containing protein, partial [Clostridia bacterium]
ETVYYGGIVGENYSSGEITGCSFRSDAEGTLAKRESANFLTAKEGLSISEMTGNNPSDAIKSLIETGIFEYAENVTVDGTEYMLTPVLAGMPTLYSLAPETVLANAAYAIPEDNSMESFFVDVPADAYYYDAVLWAAKNGIASGIDETHFAPDADCTRAQAVTFLWRASGSPVTKSTTMPFTDVPADSYYTQAVLWAAENGITVGIDETHFAPDAKCTRAQAMTFLWRAAGSPVTDSATMPFTDVAADSYYAQAVLWAAGNNITIGIDETHFAPDATCTRAQIVTFLHRDMN